MLPLSDVPNLRGSEPINQAFFRLAKQRRARKARAILAAPRAPGGE